jgi:hypothetical protein
VRKPSEELESLDPGAHLCLLYDSFAEQKAVVLPFVRDGWLLGERCVCVADEPREDEWCLELQAYGIDVEAERNAGALVVGRSPDRGLPGEFDSVRMARTVWGFVRESLITYRGVRFAVDVPSSLGRELPAKQLCHWEATLDVLHAGAPMRTICMYDRRKLSAPEIHGALRTHPLVLVNQRLRLNTYYEASAILEHEPYLNASNADAETVNRMIENLLADS